MIKAEDVIASTPKDLPKIILGLSPRQCADYASEMYKHPDFSDGVIRPTGKTTIIIVDRFLDYMRYKDDRRFKE